MSDLLKKGPVLRNRANLFFELNAAGMPTNSVGPKNLYEEVYRKNSPEYQPANFPRTVFQSGWILPDTLPEAEDESFGDKLELIIAIKHQPKSMVDRSAVIRVRSRTFLDGAIRLDEQGQADAALDIIFDQFDEMLLANEFAKVDKLLANISSIRFSVDLLLGILTVTLPAKSRLSSRSLFFNQVKQSLRDRGETEDGLLVGLD